jgi:aminoglycoside phosphotransferase family enzyme/gluconate kinase
MHRAPVQAQVADDSIVRGLMRPDAFDHPADKIALVETHISWLVFAGEFVYKIKKPLALDFLDFSSLDKRRHYCEEEIRLNQPWAPEVYLDVVAVTAAEQGPRIGGAGDVVEWAVRMRRFDPASTLDCQIEANNVSVGDIRELATHVAGRHLHAERVPAPRRDRVLRHTETFMQDNFGAIEGFVDSRLVDRLRSWTNAELDRRRSLLADRFDDGYVRDCHGDLHLGNLVRLETGITTFDCIEFNEDLRQIDTMCDLGFLVMDLLSRGHTGLAYQCLDRYLEMTGDYAGLAVLRLFVVYRCLVRAKVEVIRSQERADPAVAAVDLQQAKAHCALAERVTSERHPILIVMHGLSGTGKTWVSGRLLGALPSARIRSDVERRRLFELAEGASSESAPGEGLYDERRNDRVYRHLRNVAATILKAGYHTIVDAAFLRQGERQAFVDLAKDCGSAVVVVEVTADPEIMLQRVRDRQSQHRDASEAGPEVLAFQRRTMDSLTVEERAITVTCDNSVSIDADEIVTSIRKLADAGGNA